MPRVNLFSIQEPSEKRGSWRSLMRFALVAWWQDVYILVWDIEGTFQTVIRRGFN